jgi:LysM repeat protein
MKRVLHPSGRRMAVAMVGLVLVGVLVGGAFALTRIPPLQAQLAQVAYPSVVTVSMPLNGSVVPLNVFTTITATGYGMRPIAALELWVDGTLVETTAAPPESALTQFDAYWTWTPTEEGDHTLQVRAIDADQGSALSDLVSVSASHAADATVDFSVNPGDSVEDVALNFGVGADDILAANPGLEPGVPLPGGPIQVPLPPSGEPSGGGVPPQPPGGAPAPAPDGAPSGLVFWVAANLGGIFGDSDPLVAPSLVGAVEGCSVRLSITDHADNELGYQVYRSDPIHGGYSLIATLGSGGGDAEYVDEGVYGELNYYVAAFNAGWFASSNPVALEVSDPDCLTAAWSGFGLANGQITPDVPVELLYCYLSVDDGPWTRLPAAAETFLTPAGGVFEVGTAFETLVPTSSGLGQTMTLECWGWNGGSLVPLGRASTVFGGVPGELVQMEAPDFQFSGLGDVFPLDGPGWPTGSVPPAINVAITSSLSACQTHLGWLGLWCEEWIQQGRAILIWDWFGCWPGSDCDPDIGGFKVYEFMSNGTLHLRETIAHADRRGTSFQPMDLTSIYNQQSWGGPIGTQCYVVRAFAADDGEESFDSNTTCYQLGQLGTTNVTLYPSDDLWRYAYHREGCPGTLELLFSDIESDTGFGFPYSEGNPPPGWVVGYDHSTDVGDCDTSNLAYRSAVWFDLSGIPGAITEARLRYDWVEASSVVEGNQPPTNIASCATSLMLGSEDWRGDPYGDQEITIPAKDYLPLQLGSSILGPYNVVVTTAVLQWQQGTKTNHGFVLRGPWEAIYGDQGDNRCVTVYDGFRLDVSYLTP